MIPPEKKCCQGSRSHCCQPEQHCAELGAFIHLKGRDKKTIVEKIKEHCCQKRKRLNNHEYFQLDSGEPSLLTSSLSSAAVMMSHWIGSKSQNWHEEPQMCFHLRFEAETVIQTVGRHLKGLYRRRICVWGIKRRTHLWASLAFCSCCILKSSHLVLLLFLPLHAPQWIEIKIHWIQVSQLSHIIQMKVSMRSFV